MECRDIIITLKGYANPENVKGMARYGINPHNTLGVNIPVLRKMAKTIGKDHALALELWETGIHEARILAALIDSAALVTSEQLENWALNFDSWDVCDQVCSNLFDKTAYAYEKACSWSRREEEFVKRAGFVLMAALAVHDKKAGDEVFMSFFPMIKSGSSDDRNFVKKAVNWALRQIGKRNQFLCRKSIALAAEIEFIGTKTARWIAKDALRELHRQFKPIDTHLPPL
ncbi:MAG: DNA alkylation repair protein [Candidatus Magnetominusculus sp. LBB02]|nr:DNA alkylation repair protein [Candidatus Magnetominusculus sp. LBB02]